MAPSPSRSTSSGRLQPDDYNLTLTNGTIYRYHQHTGLKEVVDPNGNKLTFGPDGIVSTLGPRITFRRDAQGRITEIVDPNGKNLRYGYDAQGDLVFFADRTDHTTRYTYLTARPHYLQKITDPRGNAVLQVMFDATGRAGRLVDAAGNEIITTFDTVSQVEAIRDQRGNVTRLRYDDRGRVVEQIAPDGGRTAFTYDANDRVLSRTDPRGNITRYAYDARGNTTQIIDALGQVTSYEYDAGNRLIRAVDNRGRVTTGTYDGRGLLVTKVDAAGFVHTAEYDAAGRVLRQTTAACCGGPTVSFGYSGSDSQPTQIIQADGAFSGSSEMTWAKLPVGSTPMAASHSSPTTTRAA